MDERFDSYFTKALHDAKVEELLDKYKNKHFSVNKNVSVNGVKFDVIAERDNSVIAFEVHTTPVSLAAKKRTTELYEIAQSLRYNFRIITIGQPKRIPVNIDWLENALLEHFMTQEQHLIDKFAAEAEYEELEELVILSVDISAHLAQVNISGSILVSFQYGSQAEVKQGDGLLMEDSVIFSADLSLNLKEYRIENTKITLDDRYWYNPDYYQSDSA
ncbi:MAG: hypothetical protein DRR19_22835 [Candidatus Parabeggiatoa sp. nov. 1]|nr:MAG: hypothetical protein DRR19_22835 [Gammaproteobacteria bacterium]